ncbi:MAG TPA: tripartite tricarboxylate transporter TctB family protein [Sphingomicrobium sp.]|nr:tripartite tricarboxylate transporter TctB family protein [Sphingomicrobium sp.]
MVGPAPLRFAAVMLAILAGVFALISVGLGFWVDEVPGPGLLSFIAALLLLPVLAAVVLGQPQPEDEQGFDRRTLFALPLLCVCAIVVPYAGLVLGSLGFSVLWVRFFHRQTWLRAVVVSTALVCAIALLFHGLAGPIPLFPEWS